MTSETPNQQLSALPVRRRETLEIFDTALKLYRRYFWVLMGWSLLVSLTSVTAIFATFLYLFISPVLFGAVSCCVAAAVRGQNVRFRQCWDFTKPRYGAMLGALFLSWLVFICIGLVLYVATILIGLFGVFALSNAPYPVVIVCSVVGGLALLALVSAIGVFAFGWLTMVPIVSCLEDDKRGVPAMGRAFELLKGHWRRVLGMSMIIGLAGLAVMGIVTGAYVLISGVASIKDLFGGSSTDALMSLFMTWAVFSTLFLVLWNPAQILIIAVLYLDLRVRREALDLEWTAYATTPPPVPNEMMGAAVMAGAPLSAVPSDPTFAAMQEAPTSFAAGGVVNSAVPPPPPTPPGESPDFSAASFTAPQEVLPPPVDVPVESLPVFPTPPPPPPVEAENAAAPVPMSEIWEEKVVETPSPVETSGEDEARREN